MRSDPIDRERARETALAIQRTPDPVLEIYILVAHAGAMLPATLEGIHNAKATMRLRAVLEHLENSVYFGPRHCLLRARQRPERHALKAPSLHRSEPPPSPVGLGPVERGPRRSIRLHCARDRGGLATRAVAPALRIQQRWQGLKPGARHQGPCERIIVRRRSYCTSHEISFDCFVPQLRQVRTRPQSMAKMPALLRTM